MLSILIPIYNFNVVSLIKDLHTQAEKCGIAFEILCFDDGSAPEFIALNSEIEQLQFVEYKEMKTNIGRSKIRNRLAEASHYDNLLFLDCDSKLPSKDFIKKYIIHIENYNVVYGGRIYADSPPSKPQKFFRWYYGIKRESIPTKRRKLAPYKSFMTNNFLIRKKAFLSIRLNERIIGYGHEDTLFGIRLKENDVHIEHISNPVVHVGLEDFDEFLDKTHQGLKNLLFISQVVDIQESVRIYRLLGKLKSLHLTGLIRLLYRIFQSRIIGNLKSSRPLLLYFDLYKMKRLIDLDEQNGFNH
jgi:cellulose synthase/poly-beta-1,6-N-acetylglucosamine synthase-like glycosyltransferase